MRDQDQLRSEAVRLMHSGVGCVVLAQEVFADKFERSLTADVGLEALAEMEAELSRAVEHLIHARLCLAAIRGEKVCLS